MKKKENFVCPRCKEFIGNVNELEECPICGKEFRNNAEES